MFQTVEDFACYIWSGSMSVDNVVVPLILLPMNTTKNDVFYYVNEEVKKLVDGKTRLLVVQEVSYDHPGFVFMFDCRWYGSKCNMDTQHETNGKERGVLIYKDTFMWCTCAWNWSLYRCVDRCSP